MAKVIDLSELTKILNSMRIEWGKRDFLFANIIEQTMLTAENISYDPEEWIPCSERLPEFDTKVLAWVENKDPKGRFNSPGIYTATLRDTIPQHDPEGKRNIWGIPGYDSEWSVWSWSYFAEPDVKAWMPLPDPYEEDE